MEKFLDINKNFLLFLCKDTDYGDKIRYPNWLIGKIECEGKENDRFKEMTFLNSQGD